MATKKSESTVKDVKCTHCLGTGKICNICRSSQQECMCSAFTVAGYEKDTDGLEQYDNCEDCSGTGKHQVSVSS
jgi:hypothetical protein